MYCHRRLLAGLFCLLPALVASAHHSFAPHFDAEAPVALSGEVINFEQRNPHAYLTLRVVGADGRQEDWRCESHGVTQLTRNGITPAMLRPGTRVGIAGSQHRRDPRMCFFDTVYLADGRELSVNGPQFMMDYLSEAGRAAVEQYDPFTDDPTYRCEPVAIRRAWGAPSTPLSISRNGDDILIRHEWMDVERVIHMTRDSVPADTGAAILGYSIGRFEDRALVIETTHFTSGVLNQFVTVEGEPMRGLLHSGALRTVETLSFDRERNRLVMSIDHFDPVYFTRDFPTYTREYRPSDLTLQPFGCIPEQLK